MSLTTNQIRTFRTEGYLISPHFFNPKDVRALQLEVERFQREGLGRNVVPVINGDKSRINYQIMPLHDKSTLFRALWFHPSVLEIVEQLIGGPVMRWLDQIFLKPPKLGKGTEWHQDNAYFKVPDSTKGVAMWIAIHDATRENGTLEVIPRSFQFTDLVYRKSSNSDHHITCDLNAQIESQAVAAEMAGMLRAPGRRSCCRRSSSGRGWRTRPRGRSPRPRWN